MESLQSFAPLILMFLVVYLFMIRPQMKRSKNEKQFAADLKRGDKVVTKSGMHGKILDLNDDGTCIIETGAGKMKFERSAISMELSKKQNEEKKSSVIERK
ncbi:MAG TPA: preprotein translocase subunit YajC [Flavobacteriaceae bacterium]|jgi:preprotein translocase subunit YajC|nr:preprotein translocase subunit YajC [Flavobacteriaceae bacterium]HIB48599.1 preprotein translocase subunit YajC [Flavobacteriaceae bacterium]HIN97957.1 preprotein translocase subunit YajC [Flavobacteriaceae bacterium]|tara:strand:- start:51 stop:353 length:303 start_codon:yes stop_codon:yes gene_type:complete